MDHTSRSQPHLGDHVQITDVTINFLGKYTPSTKLKVVVGDNKYETGTPTKDRDTKLKWVFERPIPVWQGDTVRVQAYCHKAPFSWVNRKKCPEIKIPAEDLDQLFNGKSPKTTYATKLEECEVILAVTRASFLSLQQIPDEAILDVPTLPMSPESVAGQVKDTWGVLDDFGKSYECIGKVVEIVEGLSSVHPWAKLAVGALSAAYKVLQKVKTFGDDLRELGREMHRLLALLIIQNHARLDCVRGIVIEIMKKTQEVAEFIQVYLEKETTAKVTAAVLSGTKPSELRDDLISLGRSFHAAISTQAAIDADHIRDNVDHAESDRILARLKPVEKWPFVESCLEGTREDVLSSVDGWIADHNAPNILWLTGSPGAGKSTIASTIVSRLRGRERLKSASFFKSGDAQMGDPASLWTTIAFYLARCDATLREKVVTTIEGNKVDPARAEMKQHFELLIEGPLLSLAGHIPIVIIIDALDECASGSQRRILLNTLRAWTKLPPTFKLLVTSRNEHDIKTSLYDISHHILLQVGADVNAESSQDIHTFLECQFREIVEQHPQALPLGWPGAKAVNQLTMRAAGLFAWAHTVTKWIGVFDPVGTFEEVLAGHASESVGSLDKLYSMILARFSDTRMKKAFKEVVGWVVVARTPLRLDEVKALLGRGDTWVNSILKDLSSVISQDSSGRLYICHLSFTDFVTDSERCGPELYIDRSEYDLLFGRSCLRTMNDGLKFNIFDIESSYTMNGDIPGLSERIERCILPPLRYACSFWYQHLERTMNPINDIPALQLIETFMRDHFFHWLEVLSLTDQIHPAILGLRSVATSIQGASKELYTVLTDASKFVTLVSTMDPASIPHIYLSALPCSPSLSRVSGNFSGRFPHTLAVETGRDNEWSAHVMALKGHENEVRSVAFSPDGKLIASGSYDETVRIWDVQTGQQTSEPLRGHSRVVNCVAFSHDGKYIASGSRDGTVRIWDVRTGQQVLDDGYDVNDGLVRSVSFSPDGKYLASGSNSRIRIWHFQDGRMSQPFSGHVHGDWVNSVAFSPNGRYLASGSNDNTIFIWDVQLRREAFEPLRGHENWVYSVAFSPDGQLIASGSDDSTICIWNTQTGQQEFEPFEGHTSSVRSVAFSSDGRYIVSGSEDRTIRTWDIDTGQQVSNIEHRHDLYSVALSPDGKFIASGSDDNTVHIWDARTSHQVPESLEKHDNIIQSVSFSPNGTHIASGSDDGAIRVWDVETSQRVYGQFKGHLQGVNSVAFSPDGKSIASGSEDNTVRVWDVHSDQQAFKLFEGHTSSVYSVSFSSDGRYVVSGSSDHTVRLWDIHAAGGQQALKIFNGHKHWVLSVAFSPDGMYIASGSMDKTIRIWGVIAGQQVSEPLWGHTNWVRSVAFSPDGRYIASGSDDTTIRIWNVITSCPDSNAKLLVKAFPVLSFDPPLVPGTHRLYKLLEGHRDWVDSVAFSPNGGHIVSGSRDHTIRIWDVYTGQQMLEPHEGHVSKVFSVAFSPNGRYIASGSEDKTIRIWDISDIIPSSVSTRYNAPLDHDCNFSWHVPDMRHDPGWVYCCSNPHYKKPLFWLPRQYFKGLFWPRTKTVIGARPVKLDLTNFVHGTSWTDCQKPLPS